jgi:hypothetical protein
MTILEAIFSFCGGVSTFWQNNLLKKIKISPSNYEKKFKQLPVLYRPFALGRYQKYK